MINMRILILTYIIQQVKPNVYMKFQNLGEVVEKSLIKCFIGEKEKWTNKGNNKNEDADSFLKGTSGCSQCLYQTLKS